MTMTGIPMSMTDRFETDVTLNDLEVMGLLMLLYKEEDSGGLSEPEKTAKEKLIYANIILQTTLRQVGK